MKYIEDGHVVARAADEHKASVTAHRRDPYKLRAAPLQVSMHQITNSVSLCSGDPWRTDGEICFDKNPAVRASGYFFFFQGRSTCQSGGP